jgi:hypothetical protein
MQDRNGVPVLMVDAQGATLASDADYLDLIGDALGANAGVVVVPTSRLDDEFFLLHTGVAGAMVQKFVNYHLVLAIIGDISEHVADSDSLRAFVTEANRGRQTWFVSNLDELDERLAKIA